MGRRRKQDTPARVVQAGECYDPADYIMVHKTYFAGMQAALAKFHPEGCVCIYCAPRSADAAREGK